MSSLNINEKSSKRKKKSQPEALTGIYGINKMGKYYFPSKRTSSCFNEFDENGSVSYSRKNLRDDREMDIENLYNERESTKYDPFGMYTGRAMDAYEVPVQDADDL